MADHDSSKMREGEESSASVRGVEQGEHESHVPHQPEAVERLATLVAQYVEQQVARPVRSTTIYEQFMKLNPPEFGETTTGSLAAEEWLKKLGAIF